MAAEETVPPAQRPDRLVAFLHELSLTDEERTEIQDAVNRATEVNLSEIPDSDEAPWLYAWATALAGTTARGRGHLSSLWDGEPTAWRKEYGPSQFDELVERVAAQMVAETEAAEGGKSDLLYFVVEHPSGVPAGPTRIRMEDANGEAQPDVIERIEGTDTWRLGPIRRA